MILPHATKPYVAGPNARPVFGAPGATAGRPQAGKNTMQTSPESDLTSVVALTQLGVNLTKFAALFVARLNLSGANPAEIQLLGELMSAISDAIAAAGTSVDSAVARVTTDVTNFKATIASLQAQVDAGTATPADLQALADLKAKVDALDPASPVVLPPTGT